MERPAAQAPELSANSLPDKLRDWARKDPNRIALREKRYGIWEETTYAEYWETVKIVASAFLALGVGEGETVAIHSENRREWVYSDLAAQAIHAWSMGLYPTNPPAEVQYLLSHSEARVLIAEDQEQVDKALAVKDQVPTLRKIVYIEPRGVRSYDDPMLMSWEELMELGRAELAAHPDRIDQLVDTIDPDDVATLIYTSGTTGPPKGAMLSHRNMVWVMDQFREVVDRQAKVPDHVEILSYLPLCHVAEKLYTLLLALHYGATVNFAESIETVVQDLQEIQPTFFLGVPRIWEKMHASIMIRMADATRFKQFIFRLGLKVGYRNADVILEKGKLDLVGRILYGIFYVLVYRALKDKLGMRNCVAALSGAAPIAPDVLKFFMAIGVPIYEGYGQTEDTAYATANVMGNVKLGTVGLPNPGAEVKLAEDGEILVRHPGVFKGYFKNPEATTEVITEDGWLKTGDVGEWVGEHLKIVDRKKDIIITAGGKNISPSEIENLLKTSPYIKEAIVIGDKRKYLTALIGIEFDTVSNWALRKGITFTTYRDLSEKPEVIELIQREVDKVNEKLARVEQIKKFRLLPKELDHEEGELTATQKVKRRAVERMFADLIESMYGKEDVPA